MHLLQQLDGDLGVNLGCLQFGVAEQFLNDPHIGPMLQHVGGTGMTQEMAAARAAGMCLMNHLLDQAAQRAGTEPGGNGVSVQNLDRTASCVEIGAWHAASASSPPGRIITSWPVATVAKTFSMMTMTGASFYTR